MSCKHASELKKNVMHIKCIWGTADEDQSKSAGRRDLVQARKNFRQLRFILWRIVFYTQAAAAT